MRTLGPLKRDYGTFKTAAFTGYSIPPQLLETVEPWILEQFRQWNIDRKDTFSPAWDLGFAELRDLQDKHTAFTTLARIYRDSTLDFDSLGRSRIKQSQKKFKADAGGRVGKGFYRYALKAFYLFQN